MRVVIGAPGVYSNDAVGGDILAEHEFLNSVGIETYIYSEHYDKASSSVINKEAIDLINDEDTILIYHHAIFSESGETIMSTAKCKKILKYHNITPAHFFLPYSADIFKLCFKGRRQNYTFCKHGIDLLLADSEYNAGEFHAIGFPQKQSRVLPPYTKLSDFDKVESCPMVSSKLADGKINVLFVGRVAPNKGHINIINTAYYYKAQYGDNVRFIIAGGVDPFLSAYYQELIALTERLRVDDIVEFTGKVSFEELKSLFLGTDVFLLLSEHEGFCVPILEAQYLNLPIIASGNTAVRETIGSNQLMYSSLDFDMIATSIHTIYNNLDFRNFLIGEGRKNLDRFEKHNLNNKFLEYLSFVKGGTSVAVNAPGNLSELDDNSSMVGFSWKDKHKTLNNRADGPYVFMSTICKEAHFSLPLYRYWCKKIMQEPQFKRKQWEYVYILHSLHERGMLNRGKTGLGFGVGTEPLTACFAGYDVKVLATDLDYEEASKVGWVKTNEHASSHKMLNLNNICNNKLFNKNVSFRVVDMTDIPPDVNGFDFCWSSCALEHLGSLESGLSFVENSLKCLTPGGIAIHTTEYNLSSNDDTITEGSYVAYRKKDLEGFVEKLTAQGHYVEPLFLDNGFDQIERYIDLPPYRDEPHIRLRLNQYTCTSVGLIIQKHV